MKRLLLSLAALISAAAAIAQTTVTIPAQTITVKIPAQTITIPAISPVAAPPPIVTPAPTGASWGYYGGTLSWAGDFTQQGTSVDYHDTTGAPLSGNADILFTSTAPMGLYLPVFAANFALPNPGWTKVTLAIKPTVAGESFNFFFVRVGDIPTGCTVVLPGKYGPALVVGQWSTLTIPLADVCVDKDAALYKLGLQSRTTLPTNKWWMDNLGFL